MSIDIFLWRSFIALLVLGAFFVAHRMAFGEFNLRKVELLRARKVVSVVMSVVFIAFIALLLILYFFGGELK